MKPRLPYEGSSRKLILAFDVGTTYSGISYCLLDPGKVPEVQGVMKFPDQEIVSGDSKVPSIIWYGPGGDIKAVGSGAVGDDTEERAEAEGWIKVEWFKLHLRPKSLKLDDLNTTLPSLPRGKTIVDIFGDYLRFLYNCTQTYIKEKYEEGIKLWASLVPTMEFILSHPNGWEGPQQRKMRQAAVHAGLVSKMEDTRIHFVTEGEASLHYCISQNLGVESLKLGNSVMVIDAGGGTIDISTYRQKTTRLSGSEVAYEEVSLPECHLRGSVFVSGLAQLHLVDLLNGTRFADDIKLMVGVFDKNAKHKFKVEDEDSASFIRFGTSRDSLPEKSIRAGKLKLDGCTVASFFQPSLDCITNTILKHYKETTIKTVYLVGGFASNDWLFNKTKNAGLNINIDVCRPDKHVSKAVADGAVSYWIDHAVSTRKAKYSYGVSTYIEYDPCKIEHIARKSKIFYSVDETGLIGGCFSAILTKGTPVLEAEEFRSDFVCKDASKGRGSLINPIKCSILLYRGDIAPEWKDQDPDNFEKACTISADTTLACQSLLPKRALSGRLYYEFDHEIILFFGKTELQAQIAWKENGLEKRGPAKVIYK